MVYVTNDMSIAQILEAEPSIANILFDNGMNGLGCLIASGESLKEAASVRGVDATFIMTKINNYLAGKNLSFTV